MSFKIPERLHNTTSLRLPAEFFFARLAIFRVSYFFKERQEIDKLIFKKKSAREIIFSGFVYSMSCNSPSNYIIT